MSPRSFPRKDYEALSPYEPDRTPAAIDLSDNTNQWGPHPAAIRALEAEGRLLLERYPPTYSDPLREAIARHFRIPADSVTTGCGSDDVLDSAFRAASDPGGTVSFPAPTFSMIDPLCRVNGLRAAPVPWDPRRREEPDAEALLAPGVGVVYLCRPNNPTGSLLPSAWVRSLLDRTRRDGPVIVLDEAYVDFGGDSFVTAAPRHPRLLVVRTFSKVFGLAGLRVGFGVGAPQLVREVDKSRGPYKVGRPAEVAARAALDDENGWTERVVSETRRNRERLEAELEDRGLAPVPSAANFVLVPVGPSQSDAVARALRDEGVAVRPFAGLGSGGSLRISVGPWERMERFLAALDRVRERLEIAAPASAGGGP